MNNLDRLMYSFDSRSLQKIKNNFDLSIKTSNFFISNAAWDSKFYNIWGLKMGDVFWYWTVLKVLLQAHSLPANKSLRLSSYAKLQPFPAVITTSLWLPKACIVFDYYYLVSKKNSSFWKPFYFDFLFLFTKYSIKYQHVLAAFFSCFICAKLFHPVTTFPETLISHRCAPTNPYPALKCLIFLKLGLPKITLIKFVIQCDYKVLPNANLVAIRMIDILW